MNKNQILAEFPIGPPSGPQDSRRYDPLSAVMGGVGLVSNVVGGVLGKSAATKAGQVQQDAANAAAADIKSTTAGANPQIGDAAAKSGQGAVDAANLAAQNANQTAANAAAGVTNSANQANAILDPYSEAGQAAAATLKAGLAPGGDFNKTPSLSDLQMDPGYAFRQQQAQQQMDRSAAARGGVLSGAAIKDAINYNSGAASQEYQNAFNRFQTSTQNRYSNLFGEQGVGMQAGQAQGNNLTAAAKYGGDTTLAASEFGGGLNTNAAQFAGTGNMNAANLMASNTINASKSAADYTTGGAAAKAAGIVGGTNALTSGISGGVNAATSAATMSNLMKNPALQGGFTNPYTSQFFPPGTLPATAPRM